jgi:hypothetical protein
VLNRIVDDLSAPGNDDELGAEFWTLSTKGFESVPVRPLDDLVGAFEDHGRLARTVDCAWTTRAAVGIGMDDVGVTLEDQGVASFHQSFQDVLVTLDTKPGDS